MWCCAHDELPLLSAQMSNFICSAVQCLTEAKASLERDRSQLMTSQAVLEGQVKELQTALTHLQQQFSQVQSEVEVRRKGW